MQCTTNVSYNYVLRDMQFLIPHCGFQTVMCSVWLFVKSVKKFLKIMVGTTIMQ